MARRRNVAAILSDILDKRKKAEADFRPARVVGRNTDGTPQLLRLDTECVGRGDPSNNYTGQVTSVPAGPRFNRRGTSGVALLGGTPVLGPILFVERLEPSTFGPGLTFNVSVIGRGFSETTEFDFLLEDGSRTINPDITINLATFVDPEHFTLNITTSPAAAVLELRPLAYDDPAAF